VNKVAILKLFASRKAIGGVSSNGCLGYLICKKTKACIEDILGDAMKDQAVVHS
jgi:hypothetical protein